MSDNHESGGASAESDAIVAAILTHALAQRQPDRTPSELVALYRQVLRSLHRPTPPPDPD